MRNSTKVFLTEIVFYILFAIGFVGLWMSLTAFTWEGEFNPNDFTKWEIVETDMVSSTMIMVAVQNPSGNAEVRRIRMFIRKDGTLLSYDYFKKGEIYDYRLNVERDRYERYRYTKKEYLECMQCHSEIKEFI